MEFNELSLELKINILQYLPGELSRLSKFTTVCKQWRDMCRAPCLRKNLHWISVLSVLSHIPGYGHPLEHLCKYYRLHSAKFSLLRDWRWLSHLPVRRFLQIITLHDCDIDDENIITELTERFPSVQDVTVFTNHPVNDECLAGISKWKLLKSWKFLTVVVQTRFDISCKEIAKNCVNLQVVVISQICTISDSAFRTLINLRGTNLTELSLNCHYVSDRSYQLLSRCSHLKRLSVYSVLQLTNFGLCAIADLNQLEVLWIGNAIGLSDNDFANAFKNAKFVKLTAITLRNCSLLGDSGFTAMVKRLPDLKFIDISGCSNVSNVGFQALYDNSRNLKGLYMTGLVIDSTSLIQFQRRMRNLFIIPQPVSIYGN